MNVLHEIYTIFEGFDVFYLIFKSVFYILNDSLGTIMLHLSCLSVDVLGD